MSALGGLANFAWAVATFFVAPLIAFENVGPREPITRSTHLIRERWGEGVAGSAAIGVVALLFGFLPAAALIAVGIGVAGSSAGLERRRI